MPWYTQGDERTTWRFMSALLSSMSQESDLGITLGSKCVYHFARPILFASSLILIITFDNYLEHFSRHYTKSLQLPFKVDFKILH